MPIPIDQAPSITGQAGAMQSTILRHTADQLLALDKQNKVSLQQQKQTGQ